MSTKTNTRAISPQPPPARYGRWAAEAIGATFDDLDNGGGYLFRIRKNDRACFSGGGGICAYPVNAAVPVAIARDKFHTKSVLADAGLPHIAGKLFFAHQRRRAMRGPGREVEDAVAYASELGFPVFCKPNIGGRGNFAEIISSADALIDFSKRVVVEFESFLVEPLLTGTEHRVFVQDGRAVYHAKKSEPRLSGDGTSTIEALIAETNQLFEGNGVSPIQPQTLIEAGEKLSRVPAADEVIRLPGRRNLHANGSVDHISTNTPAALETLGIKAVGAIGLRVGAADIFDVSANEDLSDLVVIEVNGNPGLESLERANRTDLIYSIWTSMLTELLGA